VSNVEIKVVGTDEVGGLIDDEWDLLCQPIGTHDGIRFVLIKGDLRLQRHYRERLDAIRAEVVAALGDIRERLEALESKTKEEKHGNQS
jgi:hypothetical protein